MGEKIILSTPRRTGKSLLWAVELLRRLNEMPEDQEFVLRKGEHGIYGNSRPKNYSPDVQGGDDV